MDLLSAVVDGIALPKTSGQRPQDISEDLWGYGCAEGISIFFADTSFAACDLWSEQQYPTTRQSCTLSFQIEGKLDGTDAPTIPSTRPLLTQRRLQLPLSNTLFQNGQPSTLIAQRWIRDTSSVGEPTMSLLNNSRMPDQVLDFTKMIRPAMVHTLEIPLTRITRPRVVAASAGNIIKSVDTQNSLDATIVVPASAELEESISQWTSTRNSSDKGARIWALVRLFTKMRS